MPTSRGWEGWFWSAEEAIVQNVRVRAHGDPDSRASTIWRWTTFGQFLELMRISRINLEYGDSGKSGKVLSKVLREENDIKREV